MTADELHNMLDEVLKITCGQAATRDARMQRTHRAKRHACDVCGRPTEAPLTGEVRIGPECTKRLARLGVKLE